MPQVTQVIELSQDPGLQAINYDTSSLPTWSPVQGKVKQNGPYAGLSLHDTKAGSVVRCGASTHHELWAFLLSQREGRTSPKLSCRREKGTVVYEGEEGVESSRRRGSY